MTHPTISPYSGDSLSSVVLLLQRMLSADPIAQSLFVRKVLLDPNFDIEGTPVAWMDGRVVGFGLSIARKLPLEDAPPDDEVGYITLLAVEGEFQKQGIGSALLESMERFLKSKGRTRVMVSSYAPHYFTPGIDIHAYGSGLNFFLNRGYQEVHRPISMDCNLLNLQVPDWVQKRQQELEQQGMVFEPYHPEVIPTLFDFLRKEFPGEWQRFAREAIGRIELGDQPDRVWIARAKGRVIGFSHFENERFGPIGVSSAERGRGIGQVLLYKTLGAMKLRGLHTAFFMWSDDRVAARLYNEAGFVETRRFALLKKEI